MDDDGTQETLRKLEENDARQTYFRYYHGSYGGFISIKPQDYTRLGLALKENMHLKEVTIQLRYSMHAANSVFFDGLKQNSSIRELTFESGDYDYNDAETFDDVHYEILKVYQTNNNLTEFSIRNGYFHGGEHIMASVFRNSTNTCILLDP